MNTRNAYQLRQARTQTSGAGAGPRRQRPEAPAARTPVPAATRPSAAPAAQQQPPTAGLLPELKAGNARHALTDLTANARLAQCEHTVTQRFDHILPTLKTLAALPQGEDFVPQAQHLAQQHLGHGWPEAWLERSWLTGLDLRRLYAHAVFSALAASVAEFAQDLQNQVESVQDTRNFFLDCGFHAVDISPCSDGRLKGLLRYILRLPLTSFARRKAYAGALFDVETDVRHWVETELRRYREGVPTTADAGTRYLKVAVYHHSSSDPSHLGCAAHHSQDLHAIEAALERLNQFRQAIENAFCCGASTDLLLIGVDTDNDAIRVHIPDAAGELSAHRFVDNARLYTDTVHLPVDQACLLIYEAIRKAGQDTAWGRGVGEPHDGMRRLIANLLINNLSQIDYVQERFGRCYPELGHAERYISVGDGFEEVQMRNIAYFAHLHTLEEGAADMDIGIHLFRKSHVQHGLPIPIAIHYRYDARVPGARERAAHKARRVRDAIRQRYADLDQQGLLACQISVQNLPAGSPLEVLEGIPS